MDLPVYLGTFLLSILTFMMGGKIENSIWDASGPQSTVSASVHRFPALSGLRSTLRARRCTPKRLFNFTTDLENKSRYQKKSHRYQENLRYQQKNIAIYIISTKKVILDRN